MRNLLFALLVVIASNASAKPHRAACFAEHLNEAIALNQTRLPLYHGLTLGRSAAISRELILTERLSLVTAWAIDLEARAFQAAGIPIVCEDFVSISLVPKFQESAPVPSEGPRDVPVLSWTNDIRAAYRRGGFPEAHRVTLERLESVREPGGHHCMVRHVLESVARAAYLAPQYEALAREKGLVRSPAGLSWRLIELHLLGLHAAKRLDGLAASLQEDGIPILCQDVPPIATSPVLPRR